MSKCISSHGEYSEHEPREDEPFGCALCGAFDEAAAVAANRARLDALGYVEQTMYANGDSPRPLAWRNDEVMSMLAEIAELLTRTPDHTISSQEGDR